MSTLIVAEAIANMEQLDFTASEDAVIEVGETVISADRHVVERAVEAVVVLLTASIMLLFHTLACNGAIIRICFAIMTADGFVQINGTFTALIFVTRTGLFEFHFFAF